MVHLKKNKVNGKVYLYIQKSERINGKIKTRHISYLGREDKLTKEQIQEALSKC